MCFAFQQGEGVDEELLLETSSVDQADDLPMRCPGLAEGKVEQKEVRVDLVTKRVRRRGVGQKKKLGGIQRRSW